MSNYHTRAKNKSHNYIKSMRLNKETDKNKPFVGQR
jgi:hypothetical protein